MNDSGLVAQFLDRLDYGMVDVCIEDVTCGESLDWTDRHFAQGFAWRQGIVGFLTPNNFGTIQVHIWHRITAAIRPDAIRAIRVPLAIPANGQVKVRCGWGLSDALQPSYPLPAGEYALHFSVGHDPALETAEDREAYLRGFWCDLTFVLVDAAEPGVIKADEDLSPTYPLLMYSGFAVLNIPDVP